MGALVNPLPMPEVPASIPLATLQRFVHEELGLPAEDLISLRVSTDGVSVEVFARNAEGKRFLASPGSSEAATHRLSIPLAT